jgi:hypothetical protein
MSGERGHGPERSGGRRELRRLGELPVEVPEIEEEEEVEAFRPVGEDDRVPRGDPLAAEELLEEDRLEGDVLAAGHLPEAWARDPPSLLVVVPRGVAERARDDADERPCHRDEGRIAVALADDPIARGLAVHAHGHEDRPLFPLRDLEGVLEAPLPEDLALGRDRCGGPFRGLRLRDEAGRMPAVVERRVSRAWPATSRLRSPSEERRILVGRPGSATRASIPHAASRPKRAAAEVRRIRLGLVGAEADPAG